jgi:hypothetical protein
MLGGALDWSISRWSCCSSSMAPTTCSLSAPCYEVRAGCEARVQRLRDQHRFPVLGSYTYAPGERHGLTARTPHAPGGVNMYVFCAFRDMLALGCLTVTHFALGDRVGVCASPAIGAVPRSGSAPALGASSKGNGAASPHCGVPTQTALLAHCAALGFFGVFANQLLFLKARWAVGLPLVRVCCLTCVQSFPNPLSGLGGDVACGGCRAPASRASLHPRSRCRSRQRAREFQTQGRLGKSAGRCSRRHWRACHRCVAISQSGTPLSQSTASHCAFVCCSLTRVLCTQR